MTPPLACLLSAAFADPSLSTGKERDSESGNDYFGARYYASTVGRFMSPDWSAKEEPVPYAKLDDPQTLNLYAYAENNSLTRVDADGHMCLLGVYSIGSGGCPSPPPPPPPKAPKAPPIARVTTSISRGTTTWTVSTHDKTSSVTFDSLTKVDKNYARENPTHTWIGGPLEVDIVGVETGKKYADTREYGPLGATIKTDDPNGQWLHGGGPRNESQALNQRLVPTFGCTRMHNQDAMSLGFLIDRFQVDNPESSPIHWSRTN